MGLINQNQQAYYGGNAFGNYQFTSLHDIINQFIVAYVGEDKIISKTKRIDVAFHAQRALQELSFDTFKSCKSQEITIPASLQMALPQDYVNYTRIMWVDSAGIKHPLYPTRDTQNPSKYQVDTNGEYLYHGNSLISSGELIENGNFHGSSNGWNLNSSFAGGGSVPPIEGSPTQPMSTTTPTSTSTAIIPAQGFFWGYDGNALRAYDVVQYQGITQDNIPIKSGEKYKITYTLSGYGSGDWKLYIIGENGGKTGTTVATANGTYSETLTATTTASDNLNINSITFRNESGSNGDVIIDNISVVRVGDEESSTTWSNYKSGTPSENQDDYIDDTYWPADGSRFGLDPQHAQANGSYYIDCISGKIHFSSNISGKTVVLDYISDSLGTPEEMQVHKFAEEAMYKWISHAILAGKANIPEYQVNRFKKERFSAIRTAKLRLSNIKLEEITQILRGKSKHIKH